MRQPNWSGYPSESHAEAAQEAQEAPQDGDDPRCEWCDSPPEDGEYAPYCSEDCAREAGDQEGYDRVHPRPEEVG